MSGGATGADVVISWNPFEGDQSARGHLDGLLGQAGDLVDGVDGRDRDRRILGHAQRFVGAQLVLWSEAGDSAQHDTGRHGAAAKQIQQRVGDEAVFAAQPFAEVGGQLEVIHSHKWIPIHWPHHAAASPSARLTTMLATAGQTWRSSARRWASSIQVENVV